MKNEKLNVDRCFNISEPDRDDLGCHRWRALPMIEETEHGPIAWHTCERCPARALHDLETEDGFEQEPIIVYLPSCFVLATGDRVLDPVTGKPWTVVAVGAEFQRSGAGGERVLLQADAGGTLNASLATVSGWDVARCGCPAKASGEIVHHEGCIEFQAAVEKLARDAAPDSILAAMDRAPEVEWLTPEQRAESDRALERFHGGTRLSIERTFDVLAPEPLPIVHPPTDPAPPSEELRQAMGERDPWLDAPLTDEERKAFDAVEHEAGVPWDDDDPPTLKRLTPVPAIAS